MKKYIALLMIAVTSNGLASTIIHCPTPDTPSFGGQEWDLSLEKTIYYNPASCGDNPHCAQAIRVFCTYNPREKTVTSNQYEYSQAIDSIRFVIDTVSVNPDTLTLICDGTYSYQTTGRTWKTTYGGRMKSSLSLPQYSKCTPIPGEQSFSCE